MRIANAVHESGTWRVRDIAAEFELEDAWDLPAYGGVDDYHLLIDFFLSGDPARSLPGPSRFLWWVRDGLGRLGLGRVSEADAQRPGVSATSLIRRLPDDLRGTALGLRFEHLPFVPLYLTEREFAAEIENATVHAVMHIAWVDRGDGRYQGRIGVFVKPRGKFGHAYMAFIKPFRLWIVYPSLMREIEGTWRDDRHA